MQQQQQQQQNGGSSTPNNDGRKTAGTPNGSVTPEVNGGGSSANQFPAMFPAPGFYDPTGMLRAGSATAGGMRLMNPNPLMIPGSASPASMFSSNSSRRESLDRASSVLSPLSGGEKKPGGGGWGAAAPAGGYHLGSSITPPPPAQGLSLFRFSNSPNSARNGINLFGGGGGLHQQQQPQQPQQPHQQHQHKPSRHNSIDKNVNRSKLLEDFR